jgi:hypothetical protein
LPELLRQLWHILTVGVNQAADLRIWLLDCDSVLEFDNLDDFSLLFG